MKFKLRMPRAVPEEERGAHHPIQETISIRVGAGASTRRSSKAGPGSGVIPFISDVSSFFADHAASFFARNWCEEHSDSNANAYAGQQGCKPRRSHAGAEISRSLPGSQRFV
jgi:hypothetical protein